EAGVGQGGYLGGGPGEVVRAGHGGTNEVHTGLHYRAAAGQHQHQRQGNQGAGACRKQAGTGAAAGAVGPVDGRRLHGGRQLLERSLLVAAALRMMPVNGSNWFTKRLQRVMPAAPTNTTSPGSSSN